MDNELSEDKFVLFYTISFYDGDDAELQFLHFGNYYECEKVRNSNPRVEYSGNRLIKEVKSLIIPREVLENALKLAKEFVNSKS